MLPSFMNRELTEKLYVYFDETNNIRKLKINLENGSGLNSDATPFVFGGVAFRYKANQDKMLQNFQKFFFLNKVKVDGFESNHIEIKFKEFASGGKGVDEISFKRLLNSKKINLFLKWLVKNRAIIHYSVIDLRYFFL